MALWHIRKGKVNRKISDLSPVIVALDVNNLEDALRIAGKLRGIIDVVKVGLELFSAEGPACVSVLRNEGFEIFLDLKLMDIPATVERACAQLVKLEPLFLTVHTLGGRDMLKAAVRGVKNSMTGKRKTHLVGVTVLTSLDNRSADELGMRFPVREQVIRLAEIALDSGLDAVVASPLEIGALRRAVGPDVLLITPGIRSTGLEGADQKRYATPAHAMESGADFIVVGRQITCATDVFRAAESVVREVEIARGRH